MSADSYHHLVEEGMNEKKNIYDFQEFVDVLKINGEAIVMKSSDFLDFPRGVSEKSKFTAHKPFVGCHINCEVSAGKVPNYFGKKSLVITSNPLNFCRKKLQQRSYVAVSSFLPYTH